MVRLVSVIGTRIFGRGGSGFTLVLAVALTAAVVSTGMFQMALSTARLFGSAAGGNFGPRFVAPCLLAAVGVLRAFLWMRWSVWEVVPADLRRSESRSSRGLTAGGRGRFVGASQQRVDLSIRRRTGSRRVVNRLSQLREGSDIDGRARAVARSYGAHGGRTGGLLSGMLGHK